MSELTDRQMADALLANYKSKQLADLRDQLHDANQDGSKDHTVPQVSSPVQPPQDPRAVALGLLVAAKASIEAAMAILNPVVPDPEPDQGHVHDWFKVSTMGDSEWHEFCRGCGESRE